MERSKPRNRPWYRIENASESEAEVLIYGQIVDGDGDYGGVSAKQFVTDLSGVKASTIRLRVNSPGGSVFAAQAIFSALQRHPARVVAHVDGLAASAASWVILAADEVRMAQGAFLMVHNASAFAMGDARALRETADVLDKLTGAIADTYVERTGKSRQEVQDWMDAETWFTASEAKDAGFVDEIDERSAAKAEFDLSAFNHVPAALVAKPTTPGPRRIETIRDLEAFLRDEGGYSHTAAKAIASRGFSALSDPREEDGETAAIIAALHQRGGAIPTVRR